MRSGEVLAGRFVVETLADAGGMGTVFRGRDLDTGAPVAVKVMRELPDGRVRFDREARVLAGLSHPAIVRYLAHGVAPGDVPWIAMEWLEGEPLDARLAAGGLSIDASILLARRVAEALAAAHACGVVHRDVKPGNVVLVGGEAARAKLVDFGIARNDAISAITQTGAVLGTAGYMAPEQATGRADARSDVFALGCVLYECLTGVAAYRGPTPIAALAKLLLEDPPRVREVRDSIPSAIDELCAALMAREPDQRPADGAAVVRLLDGLPIAASSSTPASAGRAGPALTRGERRVCSVVLATVPESLGDGDRTLLPEHVVARFAALARAADAPGSRFVLLGSAQALLSVEGRSSAADQAVAAASAALDLRAERPDARIVVATGRGEGTTGGWMGAAIDRATRLLAHAAEAAPGVVWVDEVTRSLLEGRFALAVRDGVHHLDPTAPQRDAARPRAVFLGRPAPFVGREREMAQLESAVAESAAEGVARTVLVTAIPGTGKSRLLAELLDRIRARADAPRLVLACGDSRRTGSSLAVVQRLVAEAAGIADPTAAGSASRLAAHVAELPGLPARDHEVLAELLGVLDDAAAGAALRAARNDPVAMRAALRRAFEAWLGALADSSPVLLVVDDLHWADAASVAFLAAALRRHRDRPLTLLAFARPSIDDVHSGFARDAGAEELRLASLGRRAAERMVRAVLGEATPAATVARVVELADGNAFYLEEMIRRVAERGDDPRGPSTLPDLPESVVVMAQVRLEALDPDARRVLRAASLFGERFTLDGVASVLAEEGATALVAASLVRLAAAEVVIDEGGGRWTFRHALLASAAYAMLTAVDREAGHALVADWLLARGERDAALIAEHLLAAGQDARALPHMVRAAMTALFGGHLGEVLRLVDRGLAAGAAGEERGHLVACSAYAQAMRGDLVAAARAASEAIALLPRGTTPWFRAATTLVFSEVTQGQVGGTLTVLQQVLTSEGALEPTGPCGRTIMVLVSALALAGQPELVKSLLAKLDQASGPDEEQAFTVWRHSAHALGALLISADLGRSVADSDAACARLEGVDDPMCVVLALTTSGRALADGGRYAEAIARLDEAIAIADRSTATYLADWARYLRGGTRVMAGQTDGAARVDLEPLCAHPNTILAALARVALGNDLLARGDLDAGDAEAQRAVATIPLPVVRSIAASIRARAAVHGGRFHDALIQAEEGLAHRHTSGGLLTDTSRLLLARAEALHGLGRHPEARVAIAEALERIDGIAATLDPATRAAFLADVPPNVRTRALAADYAATE